MDKGWDVASPLLVLIDGPDYPLTRQKVYVAGIDGRCVNSDLSSTVKLKLLYWGPFTRQQKRRGFVAFLRFSFTWCPNCLNVQTFEIVSFRVCVNQEHMCKVHARYLR